MRISRWKIQNVHKSIIAISILFCGAYIFPLSVTKSFAQSAQKLIEQFGHTSFLCKSKNISAAEMAKACEEREGIWDELTELGYQYGCGNEAENNKYWRNDCQTHNSSAQQNKTNNISNSRQVNRADPNAIEVMANYFPNNGTHIEIQSRVDGLILQDVKANRGKCSSNMDTAMQIFGMKGAPLDQMLNNNFQTPGLFQPKLPAKINFGDMWVEEYPCKVIELYVKSNQGYWNIPLKYEK